MLLLPAGAVPSDFPLKRLLRRLTGLVEQGYSCSSSLSLRTRSNTEPIRCRRHLFLSGKRVPSLRPGPVREGQNVVRVLSFDFRVGVDRSVMRKLERQRTPSCSSVPNRFFESEQL